jgi:hypothetical protein
MGAGRSASATIALVGLRRAIGGAYGAGTTISPPAWSVGVAACLGRVKPKGEAALFVVR